MQSLFQYSLHIEEEPGVCDIVKNHTEYLAPDHHDHREDLIIKMIKDIDLSKGGTVLVYNQTFEKSRLKELARMFPKYKAELDKINDHVFDLYYVSDNEIIVNYPNGVKAVTPGQACVFYRGEYCLGSGTIDEVYMKEVRRNY